MIDFIKKFHYSSLVKVSVFYFTYLNYDKSDLYLHTVFIIKYVWELLMISSDTKTIKI